MHMVKKMNLSSRYTMLSLLRRLLIVTVAVGYANSASAASAWENAEKAAAVFGRNGDCNSQWQTLWPWAKNGNWKARYDLAIAILYGNLAPPLSDMNDRSFKITMLELLIYGTVHGYDQIKFALDRKALDAEGISYDADLLECIKTMRDRIKCLSDARNSNRIRSYRAIANEIDSGKNSKSATCRAK